MAEYRFADAHCHLDSCICLIPADMLIISCGTSHQTNVKNAKLAAAHENVYLCAGISPQEAMKHPNIKIKLAEWEEAIQKEIAGCGKLVGIGEIGLDYYWAKTQEERFLQHECFISQLQLAERLGLPAVVHSRNAEKECIEILENFNLDYLLHCYSGDAELGKHATAKRGWISVPPLRSKRRIEMVSQLPTEKLLAESDAPGIGSEPADAAEAIKIIADAKKLPEEEARRATLTNTAKFFRIKR
ncbi:MAG: TatD family hydrolase [Candidatus Micrarchaeota archaeon]|nr:TatD family hydrolase [Candidatus Micrarchaeota archaeon]